MRRRMVALGLEPPAGSGKPRKMRSSGGKPVVEWRQRVKRKLVDHFGGSCKDCGLTGPPFLFDFDHRDPAEKSFGIGGKTKSFSILLSEAEKCDLVCATCHRWRTHRQRCSGCEYCR